MATQTGTAANYLDLLDKFVTFVTTGLANGQNWTKLADTVENGNDRNVYFQAPGLSGADQIFMRMNAFHNTGSDYYNIGIYGATSYTAGLGFANQPDSSPDSFLLLWNQAIPYWFIANGRCAKIIAKVSTVYESAYMGFIIPYATPAEYPYPLMIGGSHSIASRRYSVVEALHRAFFCPSSAGDGPSVQPGASSGSYLRMPGGQWVPLGVVNNSYDTSVNSNGMQVWPYGHFECVGPIYQSSDYALMPLVLNTNYATPAVMGEIDGVYFVSGFANASENTVVVDGVTNLVVQNIFRTSGPASADNYYGQYNSYAAFAME